jgi:hypothetical protein
VYDRDTIDRIDFEERLLRRHMANYRLHRCFDGRIYVAGWQSTNSRMTRCELRLDFPDDYPFEMPEVYVTSPRVLSMYDCLGTINQLEFSHSFHTASNSDDGLVQICHTHPFDWDPSMNSLSVLVRCAIWVDGYEAHLRTGMTIANYIDTLKALTR